MRILPKWVGNWPVVLAMTLTSVLMMAGCSGSSFTSSNVTATPAFTPAGGTYNVPQIVTISDATANAILYCTTDGTTPTTSSPQCSQPTTVFKSEFLQAIAVAPGKPASVVASAGYTIDQNNAPIPNFSPSGGTYLSPQTVTISDAVAGANLYYTTDGTVPTASSTLYTAPITISATQTLNAIAVAADFNNSGVASATYTIAPVAAAPTFSIAAGSYTSPQQVGLSDTVSGATIYYTTDGSTPTTKSSVYKGAPITVSKSVTINALAVASGYVNSSVASATYSINLAPAPSPTFSLTLTSLSINEAAAGTTIYYTTNGSAPTTTSAVYGGPITVTQGEVVQALAAGPDYLNSTVSSYVVNFPVASTPTFSLSLNTLTINDATTGATIYYTTNGSTPTTASPVYTGPITVTEGEVVSAIAAGAGLVTSPAETETIAFAPTPEPTFSPANGLSSTVQLTITLSDAAGTTIYYTTDGTTPTTGSPVYSAPFTVTSTTTVKALATATGFSNSSVASATYTIAPGNTALSGSVVSGAAAVKNGEVQLYAAGQSGYGSSGTPLLAQPVAVGSNGAFSFTFNCPAAPGDLVYLVATGGDSGSGPNSSIALTTALGSCNDTANWPASITVNEVTTVASAYALSAFATLDTSGGIAVGAPGTGASCNAADGWLSTGKETCNYIGLTNAFKAVNNLVNFTSATDAYGVAAGSARTYTPAYPTNLAGDPNILNNSTVPTTRINALADMLASCVESSGSGCGGSSKLFGLAQISGGTEPADTLQAALNIAQNPGNNVSNLLSLVSSTLPYSIGTGANALALTGANAPVDLTLALTFTGAGLGVAPNLALSDGTAAIVNGALAIDATGNIWVGASLYNTNFYALDGMMIAEFNALGAPVTSATTLNSANPTYGGYEPEPRQVYSAIKALAIDQSGNLWTSNSQEQVLEISTPLTPSTVPTTPAVQPGTNGLGNLAFDISGDAWFINGNAGELEEFGGADFFNSGVYGNNLTSLTFDSTGALWATAAFANPSSGLNTLDVYQISTSVKNTETIAYDAFPTSTGYGIAQPTLVADGNGNVYGCDPTGKNLDVFKGASTVHTYPINTGRACGSQLVLDGQNHIFAVLDDGAGYPITNFFSGIDEYAIGAITLTLLSPQATGYTGGSSTEAPTLNPDGYYYSTPPLGGGAAIDGSGNLWVLNVDTNGTNPTTFANTSGNVLVEYIGIGAPVVTPASTALANGMLGARP